MSCWIGSAIAWPSGGWLPMTSTIAAFFDVNDLAALRMENDAVFDATHGLVLRLIREGKLDGLRIDHPDGLYDPARYLAKLQERARQAMAAGDTPAAVADERPIYLLVEKILASFEKLPQSWPVHGTTGYNFTSVVNGVFVDARAKTHLDRVYRAFIGDYLDWADTAYDSKVMVLRTSLAAELNVLANQLTHIAQADRHTRDFTLSNLRQALIEVIAAFPVYRTYVTDVPSDEDRRYIDWALARARSRSSSTNLPLLQFVRSMLLADTANVAPAWHPQVRAFAGKFQQVTSPVAAKGVEDTAFYRFTRLVSLNEVGGDPESFGTSIRQFHAEAQQPRPQLAARDAGHLHPRHQAGGRRSSANQRAVRATDDLAQDAAALEPDESWAPDDRGRSAGAGPSCGIPPLPDAARNVAGRRSRRRGQLNLSGAHRGIPGQGHARVQTSHQLGERE